MVRESIMAEIFLFPFYVFKYFFALMAWIFIISVILQTDWFYNLRDLIKDRYRELRDRHK